MENSTLQNDYHEQTQARARFFYYLSNPVRLCILQKLSTQDEMCVSDFCACMDASQPLISKHLNALKKAGLLQSNTRGQFVWYRLENEAVRKILKVLDQEKLEVE